MAVAIPFWGVFLSSTQNNALSQETIRAAALAQRSMTELRSRSAAELAGDQGGVFYQDHVFTTSYTIEAIDTNDAATGEQFTAPVTYPLTITLNPASIELIGNNGVDGVFGLSSGFYMEITGAVSPYSYSLYLSDKATLLNSGTLSENNGNVNIAIKTGNDRTPEDPQFIMHIKIKEDVPDTNVFNFYISDKGDAVKLYNDGIAPFYQYYNLSSTPGNSHHILYKISINVKHTARGELLSRLVSFELK